VGPHFHILFYIVLLLCLLALKSLILKSMKKNYLLKVYRQLVCGEGKYAAAYTLRRLDHSHHVWKANLRLLLCFLFCVTGNKIYALDNQQTFVRSISVSNRLSCSTTLSVVTTNATCDKNGAVDLTVQGGTAPFTYQWTGPNNFTAASEDLTNLAAGVYTVTVTDAAQCTATLQAVTVGATPDTTPPVIMAAGLTAELLNGTLTIYAVDIDYGSYDACSGIASMSISPSMFTCANVGTNDVTLTVTDRAGNVATKSVAVVVKADATCTPLATLPGTTEETGLQVYPRPAKEQATLSFFSTEASNAQLVVYNALGQLVTTLYNGHVLAKHQYTLPLDCSSLLSGIYLCQLRTAGKTQVVHLVVIK
jgi:hypothetical protein